MKTSDQERLRNKGYRSVLKSAIKELRAETNKETALAKLKEVNTLLDKSASYGLIHRKNASRNKSRLTNMVAKIA